MQNKIDVSNTSITVIKAKELILNFVKDNFDEKNYKKVQEVLNSCPVYVVEESTLQHTTDSIKNKGTVNGIASEFGIFIPQSITNYHHTEDGFEEDEKLSTVIHEYAHILRRINSNYGIMFEEGFATIFAEACIIHHKTGNLLKNELPLTQQNVYDNGNYKYIKAKSQISAILFILNQNNIDIEMIGEYIFGDEQIFINKCIEIFGEDFLKYYNLSSSINDEYYNDFENKKMNSEIKLIELISSYIEKNGLSLEKYFNRNNILLFNRHSSTLEKAINEVGQENFSKEDEKYFKIIESSVNEELRQQKLDNEYKIKRIRDIIKEKYNLTNKSPNEIYELLLDLGSEYYNRNNNVIENKIFIEELKKYIPNLEELIKNFIELRRITNLENFFNSIKSEELTYSFINNSIKEELKKHKEQENKTKINNIINLFNNCKSKQKLCEILNSIDNNDKIELNKVLIDFDSFIIYFNSLKDELKEELNIDNIVNYNTIYKYILDLYILKKEVELDKTHKTNNELNDIYNIVNKKIIIINNMESYEEQNKTIEKNNKNITSKEEEKTTLEQNKISNLNTKKSLINELDKINKSNFIVKLFKNKQRLSITKKLEELDNQISKEDINIESIEKEIEKLKSNIHNIEKELIDIYGISIKEFNEIKINIKDTNISIEELINQLEIIKQKKQELNIEEKELELEQLYIKRNLNQHSSEKEESTIKR